MIIIFSGPSGVGKSTIINELLNHISLYFSISHTTREKRNNEVDGKDYFFISLHVFNKLLSENKDFVGIFIDIDDNELIKRLKDRGHDNKFIEKRMELAAAQRSKINDFDYVVNNKDINTTISNILNIIYNLEVS